MLVSDVMCMTHVVLAGEGKFAASGELSIKAIARAGTSVG